MTIEERNQKIEILVMIKGWSREVFRNMTDDQVNTQYNRIMEERS